MFLESYMLWKGNNSPQNNRTYDRWLSVSSGIENVQWDMHVQLV